MKNYFSLIKFSHTIFAMPFAIIGVFYGFKVNNTFSAIKILYVVLCMVFARSAAMAFNRYLDRQIDARNARTAIREIPAGVVSPTNALIFTIASSVFFIISAWFINDLCLYLSPVALFVVLGYSYTKRFTPLCHLVLGLGLALAPVGAFLAVTEQFTAEIILLGLVVLFWVSGFDIIYALQDEEFDRINNLKSIPVLVGKRNAITLSRSFHLFSALLLATFGFLIQGHLLFWLAATVFAGLLVYQHRVIQVHDLRKINLAFFTLNGIASVVVGCLVVADFLIFP